MKIRVKLRQKQSHGKPKIVIVNAEYKGVWRNDADQKAFREEIRARYPGMKIVLYGPGV